MRNMAGELANGTGMMVKSMTRNCIEALVTTGPKEGNTVQDLELMNIYS
jgi:hypothetical protein